MCFIRITSPRHSLPPAPTPPLSQAPCPALACRPHSLHQPPDMILGEPRPAGSGRLTRIPPLRSMRRASFARVCRVVVVAAAAALAVVVVVVVGGVINISSRSCLRPDRHRPASSGSKSGGASGVEACAEVCGGVSGGDVCVPSHLRHQPPTGLLPQLPHVRPEQVGLCGVARRREEAAQGEARVAREAEALVRLSLKQRGVDPSVWDWECVEGRRRPTRSPRPREAEALMRLS